MRINIKSIAIGKAKNYKRNEKEFESAYKKDEFFNSLEVNNLGFIEDIQVDKRYHGGEDKAIHIASSLHIEKNPDFDKLFMGANIIVDDVDEHDICIGDIYKIGDVEIEVTQPRQPCWKIGVLFGKEAKRYISQHHATGWYVRILKAGTININDDMVLEKRVSNLNMKDLNEYLKNPPSDKRIIDEILNLEVIAESYKKDFLKSLGSNNS